MVTENTIGVTGECIKDIGKTIICMDRVSTNGLMAGSTMDSGPRANSMEKASMSCLPESKEKASGKEDIGLNGLPRRQKFNDK